jgi:uncharacterized protein YndB with AHSA1/START domain
MLKISTNNNMKKNETKIIAQPGKQELFIEREFDAPRELVFRAFTEPELVARWLGPNELSCEIIEAGNVEGSAWKFIHSDPDRGAFHFYGVTHEITQPERIIRTFEFIGMPQRGHVSLEILELEALPGDRTKIRNQSVFRSVEDRDGMVASGMERGVVDSHNSLDELLESLKKATV